MNKLKVLGLSMLILTLFSSSCFASNNELKDYEINKTISIKNKTVENQRLITIWWRMRDSNP